MDREDRKMSRGNYEDRNTFVTLKKTRLFTNTNVEIRKKISDGSIYYFSYGHLSDEVSGVIDRLTYKVLSRTDIYEVVDNCVVHKPTGKVIRRLGDRK
jgi:hypothetical protein